MKGRIKREDLDHLLQLIHKSRPEAIAHSAGEQPFDELLHSDRDFPGDDRAIWNANHAFWVEKLKSDTDGTWTDAQYTAAATIINTAEYQHVAFLDIASALSRGVSSGWHSRFGEEGHDRIAASVSVTEPAFFKETFDLFDTSTGQVNKITLASVVKEANKPNGSDARDSAAGVDAANGPAETSPAAVEITASRKVAKLGELTGHRARETGSVPFNQARGELFAQCGLSTLLPYAGWADFQERNHLPEDLITDLKAAYPDGFSAVDLWVGGLAELPSTGDFGPTLTAAVQSGSSNSLNGCGQSCLELLAGTQLLSEITTQSWPDIVARIAGAANLANYLLASTTGPVHEDGTLNAIFGTQEDDTLLGSDGSDLIFGGAGDDFLDGRGGADVMVGGPGDDTYVVDNIADRVIETADGGVDTILTNLDAFALQDAPTTSSVESALGTQTESVSPSAAARPDTLGQAPDDPGPLSEHNTEIAEDLTGFGQATNVENLTFTGESNFIGLGNSSNNILSGGRGDDLLFGRAGDDVLYGGAGDDLLFGGRGDDVLYGGAGDDLLFGGRGDDTLFAGDGNNRLDGGRGNDMLILSSHDREDADGTDRPDEASYGQDTIVLRPGFGNDVVVGFEAGDHSDEGHDRLDVSAYTSLSADSIGNEIQISACGPHTIITIDEDSIMLLDVSACAIGKDDFIFS